MSGIFDQIINYSPPLLVSGTVNYKGTWDASTNNPTLSASPASSTKGDYYVVSTAGTQFSISFAVGDWIISNGTAWEKVDLTDAVSSVFGRTGAVVGVSTDYSAVGITNTAIGASNPSTGAFTTVSATTPIAGTSGGTGVNNGANTITIAGNVTHAGAFTQSFTATANTALTLPTTGTLATLAGSEALSNKTITASAFNGTVGATTPSTVVATTGTFTATGQVQYFSGATTASKYIRLENTGGNSYFGIEGATPAFGGTAYAAFLFAPSEIDMLVGSVKVGAFTATGLNSTPIGVTTASTGAFTTLSASGQLKADSAYFPNITGAPSGSNLEIGYSSALSQGILQAYNRTGSAWLDVAMYGLTSKHYSSGSLIGTFSSTGLAVTGTITVADSSGSFGTISGSYNAGNQFVKLNRIGGTENIAMYADNSTRFTNNNVERMRIDSSGNVGIGTSSPAALLHVYSGASGVSPVAGSVSTIESNSNTYLSILGPAANARGIFFGSPTSQITAGIVYNYDVANGLSLRAAGATIGTFSSTGLAVTGALSCTGALAIGNTVAAAVAVASTHKVTVVIGGVTYYLLASNV